MNPFIEAQAGFESSIKDMLERRPSVTVSGDNSLETRSPRTARRVAHELRESARRKFGEMMHAPVISAHGKGVTVAFPEAGYPPAMRKHLTPILNEAIQYIKIRMNDFRVEDLAKYPNSLSTPIKFSDFMIQYAIESSVDLAFTHDTGFPSLSKAQLKKAKSVWTESTKLPELKTDSSIENMKKLFVRGFRNPLPILYNLFFHQKAISGLGYELNFGEIFKAIVANPDPRNFGVISDGYIPDCKFSLLTHDGVRKANESSDSVCPVLSVKVLQELKDIVFPVLSKMTDKIDLNPEQVQGNPGAYSRAQCFLAGLPVDDKPGLGFKVKDSKELFLQGNPFLIPNS